jgi:hypothetical protein
MEKVIFRTFKKGNDVIAFFPDNNEVNRGYMMSYQHLGQHSEADYYGLLKITKLATTEEYLPLLNELTSIYGDIKPVKKRL